MKDSNIVAALNRVLTEYFGVECKFKCFKAEVDTEVYPCGVRQGYFGAHVVYFAAEPLLEDLWGSEGTLVPEVAWVLSGGKVSSYECSATLLYKSRLRKKLLKAMLEHNG